MVFLPCPDPVILRILRKLEGGGGWSMSVVRNIYLLKKTRGKKRFLIRQKIQKKTKGEFFANSPCILRTTVLEVFLFLFHRSVSKWLKSLNAALKSANEPLWGICISRTVDLSIQWYMLPGEVFLYLAGSIHSPHKITNKSRHFKICLRPPSSPPSCWWNIELSVAVCRYLAVSSCEGMFVDYLDIHLDNLTFQSLLMLQQQFKQQEPLWHWKWFDVTAVCKITLKVIDQDFSSVGLSPIRTHFLVRLMKM